MTEVNRKLQALRDEAWQAVLNSLEYREFQILDNVVKQLPTRQPMVDMMATTREQAFALEVKTSAPTKPVRRVTQVDVAASVLHRSGEPLNINDWLAKCVSAGIDIKGDDPLPNFRSTVSRSDRFYNFTHDRVFYWWLKNKELPEKWKKATEPDLLSRPAAFVPTSREGGEADAHVT